MWKWVLMGAVVFIGVGTFAFIMIGIAFPQGFVDFFLENVDEFHVTVDGERSEVRIDKFQGGTTPKDRAFLVKKLLAIFLISRKEPEYKVLWEEYGRALLDTAEDRTLTAEENRKLREMFSDKVPEEVVLNWMKQAEGDSDPDTIWEEMESER